MSDIVHVYENDFLPDFSYLISSVIKKENIERKFYAILNHYNNRIKAIDCYVTSEIINHCSNELNNLINVYQFQCISIYCKLVTYSLLTLPYYDIDFEKDFKFIHSDENKNKNNPFFKDFTFNLKMWNALKKVDISKTENHLQKFIYNLNSDYELYPNNIKVNAKIESWKNNPKFPKSKEMINQLIKTEKSFDLLIDFLQNDEDWKSKFNEVNKAIEKLNFYLKITKEKKSTNNNIEININKYIIANKSFTINHNSEEFISFFTNIDSVMERYYNLDITGNYNPEEAEIVLNELNLCLELSDFKNPKIMKKRFKDIFNRLNIFVIHDVPYHKQWIIHEFMQSIALENTKIIGLTPSKEGFTDDIYKGLNEISKNRNRELVRNYM